MLGIVQLIESVAVSIPLSYFPNYAISLGASVAYIGLFTSSFMLAEALLSPRIGGLSDRIGRKRIILWGLLGDVVLGIFTGLAPDWIWLLLIRVVNGGVTAAATLPAEALLIDIVHRSKIGEATGFVIAMSMVGRSIGPVFGGSIQWAAQSLGLNISDSYRVPYFVDSLLALLALILVARKIREPRRFTETAENQEFQVESNELTKEGLSLSIKILLVASFVAGLGVGFIAPVSVLFYGDKFGISPVEIGSILSLVGFIGIFASWFSGRLSDRIGRKPIVVLGGLVARLCVIALPLTFDVGQAVIVMALRRVSYSLYRPALHALRADLAPARSRGRVFGMFKRVFAAGDITGPILGTWLYSLYRFEKLNIGGFLLPGYGAPFFVDAFFGLISTVLILVFVKETKKTASTSNVN